MKKENGITITSLVVLLIILCMAILTTATVILRRGITQKERDAIVERNDITQIRLIYAEIEAYQKYANNGEPVSVEKFEQTLKDSLLNGDVSVDENIINEGTPNEVRQICITMPSKKTYMIDGSKILDVNVVNK